MFTETNMETRFGIQVDSNPSVWTASCGRRYVEDGRVGPPDVGPILLNHTPVTPDVGPILLNHTAVTPDVGPILLNHTAVTPDVGPILLNHTAVTPDVGPILLNHTAVTPDVGPILLNHMPVTPDVVSARLEPNEDTRSATRGNGQEGDQSDNYQAENDSGGKEGQ